MLFRELSIETLKNNLVLSDIQYSNRFRNPLFIFIENESNDLYLKNKYKPLQTKSGIFTQFHMAELNEKEANEFGRQKLHRANILGEKYDLDPDDAALKLHISINNIGDMEQEKLLKFIQFLKQRATVNNRLGYKFKIITPNLLNEDRFKNNDQFTVYFDKYSSLGEIIQLTDDINTFLKTQEIQDNMQPLGEKDSCSLNSFVSARFETSRLLSQYAVYPFFDLELSKFFGKHSAYDLRDVPVCALEAVFNKVIKSQLIQIPDINLTCSLTRQDSDEVQKQFDIMLNDPCRYLGGLLYLD